MQLHGLKPSKITGALKDRPELTGALVKVEEKSRGGGTKPFKTLVLYATNSYVFLRAVLGPKEDRSEPGPIPLEALRHMERGVHVELGEKEITAGITHYDRVMSEYERDPIKPRGDRPYVQEKWDELLPKHGKKTFSVGINARLLKELSDAMGRGKHDAIELEFDLDQAVPHSGTEGGKTYIKAIKVKPHASAREAEGLLMPVRLNV